MMKNNKGNEQITKRKAGFMSSGPRLYLCVHIGGIIIEDFSDFVLQHCS